jgi:hypothetical protein
MAAESPGTPRAFEVVELLRNLKLSEAERDGVFLAREEKSKLPEVKWTTEARLLTVRGSSEQSLERQKKQVGIATCNNNSALAGSQEETRRSQ